MGFALQQPGEVVRVGFYENPPKIFTGEDGAAAGFWVDVIQEIAQKEGLQVQWVHGSWEENLARLEAGEIDMLPDVGWTLERSRRFTFSAETVLTSWARIYVPAGGKVETILDLGRKHNLPLPAWDAESLRPHVQVTDPQPGVMAFLAKYKWLIAVLVDYDACRRIAYENVEDLLREQIDYAELRFSPWFMAEGNGLNPQGVVEAVVDGVEAGVRDFGVPVQLIGILSRTYGPEICTQELQSLLAYKDHLVAVDLAGDEARFPARSWKTKAW